MKKQEKLKYQEVSDEPVLLTAKKKVEKPWYLEAMVVDEAYANSHSFFLNKAKVGDWVKDSWFDKLLSVNHGIDQMNKIARTTMVGNQKSSIGDHWRFAGKRFRLINADTKEIVELDHTDTEFYAK